MTTGGFRVATIRGIPIRVHISFLIVLPFLAYAFARAFRAAAELANVPPSLITGSPWVWGLGVAVTLFVSVLVHELAHALYAIAKGGRVQGITLLMIGGVSEISEPPKGAKREAVMALVGPLVSLGLGIVFFLLHLAAARASFSLRFALFYMGSLNTFLGLFNLLPAFPMDGGRILRALLTGRLGVVRATGVAARVGQVFAVLFGLWGLFSSNLFLVLIAFFVFMGAEAEKRGVIVKTLLGDLRVRDVMRAFPPTVSAGLSVHEAAELMLRDRAVAVPIIDVGRPAGLLTLERVQAVPAERRWRTTVGEIAVAVPTLSPSDEAAKALRVMAESDLAQVPVAEDARFVGTVTREDIARTLKLVELEATQHGHGPPAHAGT